MGRIEISVMDYEYGNCFLTPNFYPLPPCLPVSLKHGNQGNISRVTTPTSVGLLVPSGNNGHRTVPAVSGQRQAREALHAWVYGVPDVGDRGFHDGGTVRGILCV